MKRVIILTLAIAALATAQPALVTIGGRVYNSDGTGFTGKLTISNASLVCSDAPVPASSRDYSALAGVVSPAVQLFPLADCTPGYSYIVVYQGKERSTVYWDVHASPTTTTIGVVQRQGPIAPSMQVRWGQIVNPPSFQPTLTWLGTGIAGALDQILGTSAQKPTSYFQPSIAGAPVIWPAFAAVATSGSYVDLANKPLLTPAAIGAVPTSSLNQPGGVVGLDLSGNASFPSSVSAGNAVLTTPLAPASGGVGGMVNVPPQLRYLGDGSDGAINCNGPLSGTKFATTFNIAVGNTCTVNAINTALAIYATGACTISGTLNARGIDAGFNSIGDGGGPGGGGGGGAAAGIAGSAVSIAGTTLANGGTAGALGGNPGGNANSMSVTLQRAPFLTLQGIFKGGSKGGNGGSAGPLGGNGGQTVVLICASVGVAATGVIDVSGALGLGSTGNSIGSSGGGGGGYIWLIGRDSSTNAGTLTVTGGVGGTCGAFTICGAGGTGGDGWSKVSVMR